MRTTLDGGAGLEGTISALVAAGYPRAEAQEFAFFSVAAFCPQNKERVLS